MIKYLILVLLFGCMGKLYGHTPGMVEIESVMLAQDTLQRTVAKKVQEETKQKAEKAEGKVAKAADVAIKEVPKAKNKIAPKAVGPAKVNVKTRVAVPPVKVRVKVKVNPSKIKL
ncbi:hypothetical protein [Pseudopedobacter sp.]|uniref:hypothetical protein n=1 Tax=Pseudopedobacter sp. TaxID=1936787 RepID=UPI00333E2D07